MWACMKVVGVKNILLSANVTAAAVLNYKHRIGIPSLQASG